MHAFIPRRVRHHARSLAFQSLALMALWPLGLWAQEAVKPASAASAPVNAGRPVLTVTLASPQIRSWPQTLQAGGAVAAWQEAIVGSETAGLAVRELRVEVGDRVQKGQVLAVMQSDTLQAELAQTEASLAEVQAQAQEARLQAERARNLQQQGFFSAAQLSQAVASEAATLARVQAVQAQLRLQRLRLQQTEVRAPDAGVVSARLATLGQVPGLGNELFRLIRQGRLEWRAEVTAVEAARLRAGLAVQIQVPGRPQPVNGKVRVVAPALEAQTRNALVYVDLPAGAGDLRAGSFVRGEFTLGRTEALVVPQTAVVVREGFNYVYVLDTGERVAQRKVRAGRQMEGQVEILEGLQAQDRVVASGGAFLNQGDRVRVVTATTRP